VNWELEEEEEEAEGEDKNEELKNAAVRRLYKSIEIYPDQAEKIEKFCLPFLRVAGSNIAIERSIDGIVKRPHLARLYLAYLSRFVPEDAIVRKHLGDLLESSAVVSDSQRMYLLGALVRAKSVEKEIINAALRMLSELKVGQEVRALAAIFGAKYGTPQQRRTVRLSYEGEPSSYVRAAILYASRHFTGAERKICIKAWGAHNTTNALIAHTLRSI